MAIDKEKLLDPIDLELQSKYQELGITYLSNNNSVVNRDSAGNVVLIENESNPLLIIQPVVKQLINRSVIKVIDTQFNYFKFPVRVIQSPIDLDLDLDLDFETDNISANLTIPIPLDSKNQPINFQKIDVALPGNTWYYDGVESTNGVFKQLQFTGGNQTNPNSYTVTEEILNTLREQNKTLRFKIQTQYRTGNTNRTEFRMRLNRSNRKIFHEFKTVELLTEQNVSVAGVEGENNPHGFGNNTYPVLSMTYIIDMDDTKPGDTYNFSALSSNEGFILAQNSYWDIDIVDIPTNPGIYGASSKNITNSAGVYQFSDNTLLRDGALITKAKRSATTNQEVQIFT
tara:strand:- start:8892 stop:9920 length:1029 start_codon:yes stop_codon:yes gene_type:complete